MGWGMLQSAAAGPGGAPQQYSQWCLHQHEPHLMTMGTSPPLQHMSTDQAEGQNYQQQCCGQQDNVYAERGEDDFLASLLQVSGHLEDSLSSVADQESSSPGEGMPSGSRVNSVAATRSHLIKEGLKLTIQSKRRERGQADLWTTDDEDTSEYRNPDELTEEDEERRRRRRERNKVAATKCRNKKKERTQRLAVESTCLESNNQTLKEEIQRLEQERQELMELLRSHGPACPMQQRSHISSVHQYHYLQDL